MVDHKNGDRTNNKLENLRWVTAEENAANRKCAKETISMTKSGTWRVRIAKGGERMHIGIYQTIEEAREVYQQESMKLRGDFHRMEGGAY
jgi:hypothetical protein